MPAYARLFRIEAKGAEAIGKEMIGMQEGGGDEAASLEREVWVQLRTCYDPEIPINIVDLGLIYDVRIVAVAQGGHVVTVKMTLTTPGCGMGAMIAAEARHKLSGLPGVKEANVEVVWDPPWSPEMISLEGKERLGMI